MELSEKSKGIDNFLTSMMGISRQKAFEKRICISCLKPATEFNDPLSEKEYSISCLCQKCQDEIFG